MPSSLSKRRQSVVLLFTAGLLWSTEAILIKWVSSPPIVIAGWRSIIAAAVVLLYVKKPLFHRSRAQLGAAVQLSAAMILFIAAVKLTTAANALVLVAASPIYSAILGSVFLKEKLRIANAALIALIVAGCVLLFFDDFGVGRFWGNVCGFFCGLSYSGHVLCMRMQKEGSPSESVILAHLLTFLLASPFILHSFPNARSWVGLSLLGFFPGGIAYILFSYCIKHVTALEGNLFPMIETVLSPAWVFLFLGERPGRFTIAGGILVLISLSVQAYISSQNPLGLSPLEEAEGLSLQVKNP